VDNKHGSKWFEEQQADDAVVDLEPHPLWSATCGEREEIGLCRTVSFLVPPAAVNTPKGERVLGGIEIAGSETGNGQAVLRVRLGLSACDALREACRPGARLETRLLGTVSVAPGIAGTKQESTQEVRAQKSGARMAAQPAKDSQVRFFSESGQARINKGPNRTSRKFSARNKQDLKP
jgi:hypothetical protein